MDATLLFKLGVKPPGWEQMLRETSSAAPLASSSLLEDSLATIADLRIALEIAAARVN
jgi:hypothetical protein